MATAEAKVEKSEDVKAATDAAIVAEQAPPAPLTEEEKYAIALRDYRAPTVSVGDLVLWYKNGYVDSRRPEVRVIVKVNQHGRTIDLAPMNNAGEYCPSVRHITDPRLKEEHNRESGAWDYRAEHRLLIKVSNALGIGEEIHIPKDKTDAANMADVQAAISDAVSALQKSMDEKLENLTQLVVGNMQSAPAPKK